MSAVNWTSPSDYIVHSNPTLVERVLAGVASWAAAARAQLEEQRLARVHWAISARGSPDIGNHLRKDIGLPPLPHAHVVDVDLYR